MLLWIEMDIEDQIGKVSVRTHFNPPESLFKQAAGALICFVDSLGVGVEEIGEMLRRFGDLTGL